MLMVSIVRSVPFHTAVLHKGNYVNNVNTSTPCPLVGLTLNPLVLVFIYGGSEKVTFSVADLGGRTSSSQYIFFNFMQFSANILPSNRLVPPTHSSIGTSLKKSWIRS